MTNVVQNINNNFKAFYENELPAESKEDFISLVCNACGITYNHFYVWLNKPQSIKLPAKKQIAQISGKTVFELFQLQTNLQVWFYSLSPNKKSMIIAIILKRLEITRPTFIRYLNGKSTNERFNVIVADFSSIQINKLYEFTK